MKRIIELLIFVALYELIKPLVGWALNKLFKRGGADDGNP